ncbi:FAD/NAD(P)-binding protein [Rahnella perminowiae]|uniref:FAD/NAD(P)-binding protein n=1 Tax=Rahnella perminowiae TaxID=2816244 RepID=UPI00215CB049|nr:FAD/NAD(P)-binding protein [Rahnella perminowiae]MCR8998620.1 FAD/NAD(P)-binding protein [Rahnella perminowiae]
MKKQHDSVLHAGVVGVGPRGLVVLERLTHYAQKYDIPMLISIIDPQKPGIGVHSPSLPEYKMLNTVAGQITLFPDENMLSDGERVALCVLFWNGADNTSLCLISGIPMKISVYVAGIFYPEAG